MKRKPKNCNNKMRPKSRTRTPTPVSSEHSEAESIEEHERDESPEIAEVDASDVQYELNFVDKDSVMARTRVYRLGEFKLQPLLAEAIKKAVLKIGKGQEDLKWVSGRVEMRHKGLKKVADYPKNDVEDDDDDWNEV
jgi:hypothetical protein